MTTGTQRRADLHCEVPVPAESGICHCLTSRPSTCAIYRGVSYGYVSVILHGLWTTAYAGHLSICIPATG